MVEDNIDNKGQYLQEDQDLIDRLKSIESVPGVQVSDNKKYEISSIQIEAILRNRKSMNNLDKSTSYFSKVLGVFALIQIIIAILQFSLSAISMENIWIGFLSVVVLVIIIGGIIKKADKGLKDK